MRVLTAFCSRENSACDPVRLRSWAHELDASVGWRRSAVSLLPTGLVWSTQAQRATRCARSTVIVSVLPVGVDAGAGACRRNSVHQVRASSSDQPALGADGGAARTSSRAVGRAPGPFARQRRISASRSPGDRVATTLRWRHRRRGHVLHAHLDGGLALEHAACRSAGSSRPRRARRCRRPGRPCSDR